MVKWTAGRAWQGICSDASEPATKPRLPKSATDALIAAPLPQPKDSGLDSPALPLRPLHLPCHALAAVHFTGNSRRNAVQPCRNSGTMFIVAKLYPL